MANKGKKPVVQAEPRPMGRPTDYNPEYCHRLIAHMREGNSFESFGAVIGSHRGSMYNWLKMHPEFLDARKQGLEMATRFYENLGKMMATGQLRRVSKEEPVLDDKFQPVIDPTTGKPMMRYEYQPTQGNPTAWIFLTKNIIGWRDKKDINLGSDPANPIRVQPQTMTDEEIKARALFLAKEIAGGQ